MMAKKLLILGSHGFPAKYGGFETLAENLSVNLDSRKYEILVFCSKRTPKPERGRYNKNIRFIRLPIDASGYTGILYDLLGFLYTLLHSKSTILYLGPTVGSALFIPRLRNHRVVTNFGGLNEWERPKYKSFEWLLRLNYRLGARFSNVVICDNNILRDSLKREFNADSTVIRYGGDHLQIPDKLSRSQGICRDRPYALVIARAQSDSMFELLIEAWQPSSSMNLVIVSNWDTSEFGRKMKSSLDGVKNISAIGPIYDQEILTDVRLGAHLYIHSHSYCGTAPSLVESIVLGCPIVCFDVETNREVSDNRFFYFKTPKVLREYIESYSEKEKRRLITESEFLKRNFKWRSVTDAYSKLI